MAQRDQPFKFRSIPTIADVQHDTGRVGGVRVVAGYRRCVEYNSQGDFAIGQDDCYAWAEGRYAVAVVVDGVSQSFFGHLAAQWLTDGIRKLLQGTERTAPIPFHPSKRCSRHWSKTFLRSESVDVELPDSLPKALRTSLEKRDEVGSLAVFVAAVFDLENRRVKLYAVGDPSAVVFRADGTSWHYLDSFTAQQIDDLKSSRYSSRLGFTGVPHEEVFEEVNRPAPRVGRPQDHPAVA